MDASWRLAIAAVFVWLGMVLAISFIEASLKFRAPGIDLKLGLAPQPNVPKPRMGKVREAYVVVPGLTG